jgi:hypothetical protein
MICTFIEIKCNQIRALPKYLLYAPCRNLSFGLATKAKGLQGVRAKGKPDSVGKCEGMNPHTPKATPTLGDVVPVDS